MRCWPPYRLSAKWAFQVEDYIFNNFVPATGDTLREYLHDFSNQARQLTGVGIGLLIITAFMMLVNIERAFQCHLAYSPAAPGHLQLFAFTGRC